MKTNYNSTAFTPKEVEKGLHLKLIKHLLEEGAEFNDAYNDIHVWSDSYCTIVEWNQVHFDNSFGDGKFEFVDYDERIAKEVRFPDNHFELLPPEEEDEAIKEWLKENPGWEKNEWGFWYNVKEEKEIQEHLKDQGFSKADHDDLNEEQNGV